MRKLFLMSAILLLCGCELIYKLPTRQGNVIEQKQLDQLQPGMTRDQVRFLLGTPIATSPYRSDRWDYVGYYRSPRGKVFSRTVSLYFGGDSKLARMEGIQLAAGEEEVDSPDIKRVISDDKKDKLENERNESEATSPQPADPDKNEPSRLPNP